ncbi:MAG: thioredoxin domain-containing protein [Minisyncoccia bacterium]
MKNKWIWGLVGLLVLCFVVIGLTSRNSSSTTTSTTDLSKYPVLATDHILGNMNAKVIIVEYGDFQCPACATYASLLKQAFEIYKGQVAIVFRHFPLLEIHNNALASAMAAEAAGTQGKFFEMLDALYLNQRDWELDVNPQEKFNAYAKQIGLDVVKFEIDSKSKTAEDVVKAGRLEAQNLNLSGTPTLFVNGKLIKLPSSGTEFQQIIETALK